MYYGKYSVGYIPSQEKTGILVYDRDMTTFIETEDDKSGNHIVQIILVDTYKYENCENYLDENGLFMGILPPEFIKANIQDYHNFLKKEEEKIQKRIIEKSKKPLDEDFFIRKKSKNFSLEDVLDFIEMKNNSNLYYGGYEFLVEEYYKDILIKYWGNYKI